MKALLQDAYGFIFEDELIDEIHKVGIYKQFKQNDTIIEIGDYLKSMPLLISGAIKVLREDQDGDELLLYFLERGDTCAMTLTCCIGNAQSEIRAIAESDTELLMIPVQKMEEWTAKYTSWRQFVFESYQNRLSEMLDTLDTIAFLKMDERLMKYLRDKAKINQNETLKITHQQIAYELHTSRVVISRLLKKLEIDNKIKLHRNSIEVIDL
ncbi:Crp/Fnr family transcriptional regulator [Mesohalobacter halotolerans]|uniref:Crp/Fnr family transcriptional regulator n=1 Tax=Mesohalobacter halotolerans TaxID=1883405 RepID=A0A4U5TPK8_9FLAO|nr:Crp/Fnr family transcriptional regulator [Mesohalobacter halotolerans]MBS3737970.1 Crp/Fnr family transcriptional regulator [Psychroflexus sp.]TKS56047.1 Crp/Fnr family transcriptional regulator [Mesohalobacter halotolerans]